MKDILSEYSHMLTLKQYSLNTRRNYETAFHQFLSYFHNKEISALAKSDIESYLLELVEKGVSSSLQNLHINAIKFYYEKVLGRPHQTYELPQPHREMKLPTMLSEEEVMLIFKQVSNIKHKAILYLIYSGGLQLSEAINLKIQDIDSKRNLIFIRTGKSKKDQTTLLSQTLLALLRNYYKEFKPKNYLFEGQDSSRYSVRSVQCIFKTALQKSGVKKHASIHTLRHSFATHLLKQNTDLRYIQELLNHANSKTTEIYTHITKKGMDKIVSPLNSIAEKGKL